MMAGGTRGAIVNMSTICMAAPPSYCSILSIDNIAITITFRIRGARIRRRRRLRATFAYRARFVIDAADYRFRQQLLHCQETEINVQTPRKFTRTDLQERQLKACPKLLPTFRTLLPHSFIIDYIFTPSDVSRRWPLGILR